MNFRKSWWDSPTKWTNENKRWVNIELVEPYRMDTNGAWFHQALAEKTFNYLLLFIKGFLRKSLME